MACNQQLIISQKITGGGGGLVNFSDDFNRADGALGSNWSVVSGAADVNTNQMRLQTGGFTENLAIYVGQTPTTVNQYAKFVRVDDASFPSIPFRWTNSGSPYYTLDFTNTDVSWTHHASLGGTATTIQTVGLVTGAGSVVGCLCFGTGTSTVFRVWVTPPSDTPTSPTNWGGDTTPDAVLDNDPGSPVNTGFGCGLGGFQGTANTERFDGYFGGDVPP